jgi:RNA-binding protein NOB1
MEFLTGDANPDETETVLVACLTTDFAMQNVLKQIGLNVLSTEGILIKVTKTWILRCYACFTTTPHMDKQFCPKCGNKTLKRVSVTLNEDGSQEIHISTRRPLNTKGKKFSLPKQKGGKYAVNPFLTADQQIPQQKRTAMARASTNAMSADYTAGKYMLVVRFCYHRTIPMMRFAAYYVSIIGCNSNLCILSSPLYHNVSEKSLFLLHRKKVFL